MIGKLVMIYIIIACLYAMGNVIALAIPKLSNIAAFKSGRNGDDIYNEYYENEGKKSHFITGLYLIIISFIFGAIWPVTIYLVYKYWDVL